MPNKSIVLNKCHTGGYSAQVWDAPDRAPIATVDTRHCLGCKSLVEVPVVFHGGGLIGDQDSTPDFINRCPKCDSSNVQPWDAKLCGVRPIRFI